MLVNVPIKYFLHFKYFVCEIRQYLVKNWKRVLDLLTKRFPDSVTDIDGPDYIPSDSSSDSELEADLRSGMST